MINQGGGVTYRGPCFAAGTLVHTDMGLSPIEQIRVDTRVLSQPERGDQPDFRPVVRKVSTPDQESL